MWLSQRLRRLDDLVMGPRTLPLSVRQRRQLERQRTFAGSWRKALPAGLVVVLVGVLRHPDVSGLVAGLVAGSLVTLFLRYLANDFADVAERETWRWPRRRP